MNDSTTGDSGGANDASERMKGLSEARRRLLEAMLQQQEAFYGAFGGGGAESGGDRSTPDDEGIELPDPSASLVAMKATGSRPPFFCVHAILGSAFPYHRLALHMDPEQPFYGLQSPGLDGAGRPLETIEAMAEHYIELIRGVQPHGPYYIGGYSFGGWVAFEMAQQLTRAGEEVAVLAILGAVTPVAMSSPVLFEQFKYAAQYADDYRELVLNSFWSDAMRTADGDPFSPTGQAAPGNQWQAMQSPFQPGIAAVATVNNMAQFRYVPRPYAGEITLFSTAEQQAATHPDETLGWKMLSVKDVVVHQVAGNHLSMLQEPFVKELADRLCASLRERQ